MGTAERREREKEQRKQAIINCAEKIFFSKGYEKATMDEVAAECELSKGTLYLYFKNKEEVYLAIILRGMKVLRRLFEEAVDNKKISGLEKVRAIGQAYTNFYFKYPNYYDALIYYSLMEVDIDADSTAGAELKTFKENNEVMTVLVEAIRDGVDDGTIRNDIDPEKAAIILWGQSSGVLQLMTTKGHAMEHIFAFTREEILESYFEFTYNALKA